MRWPDCCASEGSSATVGVSLPSSTGEGSRKLRARATGLSKRSMTDYSADAERASIEAESASFRDLKQHPPNPDVLILVLSLWSSLFMLLYGRPNFILPRP